MDNTFMNAMAGAVNYTQTLNGAITHKSTLNKVMDMFALGGSYRGRSDDDCILLFKNAYEEDPTLAVKCLFYLGDCREGQGERRFFRTCFRWLAQEHSDIAQRLVAWIPFYRRWDDMIYSCIDTPLEEEMFDVIRVQLNQDLGENKNNPSLLGKWLPSENASSSETKYAANKIRQALGMTHKGYRIMLTGLRKQINVLEQLMSNNEWNKIQFDKIPSKAGMKYSHAFANREETAHRYADFMNDKNTKVNASVLNPVDIAKKVLLSYGLELGREDAERIALQKTWDNLPDYYNGKQENGIAVVDVSGSMTCMGGIPLAAAVSLGAYIAEKSSGPFANHFITFSNEPQFVEFEGVDIYDKFRRCERADWGMSTNIEAVFDLLLNIARKESVKVEDLPKVLYIFSDMQFNYALDVKEQEGVNTLLEGIAKKWAKYGYELPRLVFWNLNASTNNIPAIGGRFSYISGFSPVMIEQVLQNIDGWEICLDKLLSERYSVIYA